MLLVVLPAGGEQILRPLDAVDDPGVQLGSQLELAPSEATRELVKEGFTVLAYTSDDPRSAVRIKEAGAASVMPAKIDLVSADMSPWKYTSAGSSTDDAM